jgi:hypothetical protein
MKRAVIAGFFILLPFSFIATPSAVIAADQLPAAMKLIMKGVARSGQPIDVTLDILGLHQSGDGSYAGVMTIAQSTPTSFGLKPEIKIVLSGDALSLAYDRAGSEVWCTPVLLQLHKGSAHLYEGVHPNAPDLQVYLDGSIRVCASNSRGILPCTRRS